MKKVLRIAAILLRTVFLTVLAAILIVTGVAMIIYSPWGQDFVRRQAIEYVNSRPGMHLELDSLYLGFPLHVGVGGMLMAVDGDTIVKVGALDAVADPMPLLKGKVDIERASLTDGYYRMGAPDSAMFLQIQAGDVQLRPSTVTLATLDIDVSDATLRHSTVSILLNPDTTATPPDTASQQTMRIRMRHLDVEDLTYRMAMLPTIDSLAANIGKGSLDSAVIDLGAQTVSAKTFLADSVDAAYIAPTAEQIAATPVPPASDDSTPSRPWTVTIDSIALTQSHALYTTKGLKPLPGLDFGYIEVSDLDLSVAGFYNQATVLRLPMRLSGTERCGLSLKATGEFMLNDNSIILKDFDITTPLTHLKADGMMGIGDLMSDPRLPLRLVASGSLALADVRTMFPGYAPYMAMLPRSGSAILRADIDGNPGRLKVNDLRVALPGIASLTASGAVDNVFDPARIGGDIALSGNIVNVKSIVNAFVSPSMGLTVPPMSLRGNVAYRPGVTKGNLRATTLSGDIALDGYYDANAEGYSIDLNTRNFPVNAFMADLPVGRTTLSLKAAGRGFDIFSPAMHTDVTASVESLEYNGYTYSGIDLKALIADGKTDIDANVDTGDLTASLTATGNLTGNTYSWTVDVDGDHIDLLALKFSDTPATATVDATADISLTPARNEITGIVNLSGLTYHTEESDIDVSDVYMHLLSNDSVTSANIHNRDLVLTATSPYNYAKITPMITSAMELMQKQIDARVIHVDTLQKTLPKFDIDLVCGNDNALTELLAASDMGLGHLAVCMANDSALALDASLYDFRTGATRLDTITATLSQTGDKMRLLANINNRPGNMDNWAHITADALINSDRVSMRLTQQNSKLETGFDLGAIAMFADSTITARMFPLSPVIGYQDWSVNLDNFLRYNFVTREIGANLRMRGDKSSIEIMSHTHEPDPAVADSTAEPLNDILVKISDIHIADWIAVNPFAPPITGNLSADMHVKWDGGSNINGKGNVSLTDFFYDNQKVASLQIDADVATSLTGTTRATADVIVDGERTMHLAGNLNDSTAGSPFNLDLTLVKFPLSTVNPFLPADMARLSGTLNGEMLVSGDASQPVLNGVIYFTDAAVKAIMTNTSYKFSEVKIPVTDNIVTFDNFNILGANENPLYVNGSVDIRSITSPSIDLTLAAKNMMLVNTKRAEKGATVFGKAYIDLDASLKGNMSFMKIDADLDVLTGTNVSYVLSFDTSGLSSVTDDDMVKFVNLNDTASVAAADSITQQSMLMSLNAQLNIQNGTTIVVQLPTSTRDKIQLQPEGDITYTLTPMSEDGRVTGRINLNGGMARYTMPVVGSEKTFNISSGSYVAFNGDMMNPVLNLHAVDPMKINVTRDNQSRLVNFDVMLGVTGTLEQMDVKFDLEAPDDLSVTNELESMSAEQRANQAMNLLLYNMYTGPGTTGSANLSVNPLFSFLESQINNWAAQNIKGVDLSFNIDKYNQTTNGTTSSAMSYSYQVSKSMFNDRFKIVVGGNYTTDNNADENIAENLINDISFEYYLNDRQTMLVKLFRHVGFESILEGEITQTGVGFVYRRKLNSMYQMIPKFIRPKHK